MAIAQFPPPRGMGAPYRAPNTPAYVGGIKSESKVDRDARAAQIESWLDANHDRIMLRR